MKQSVVAVILAAGRGLRMGGELPKQYLELEGRPILAHTLAAFDKASSIDALVIVSNDIEHVKERVLMPYPVSKPVFFVQGGEERQHSVWNAVQFIKECDIIVIHDGVRPLIAPEVIENPLRLPACMGLLPWACPARIPLKKPTTGALPSARPT